MAGYPDRASFLMITSGLAVIRPEPQSLGVFD
jgi:hypothetical protein